MFLFQIAYLSLAIDPNFVAKDKMRKSPCKHSPQAASPKSTRKNSPQAASEASPWKTRRTSTACSFDEKEEVTKYMVRISFDCQLTSQRMRSLTFIAFAFRKSCKNRSARMQNIGGL